MMTLLGYDIQGWDILVWILCKHWKYKNY